MLECLGWIFRSLAVTKKKKKKIPKNFKSMTFFYSSVILAGSRSTPPGKYCTCGFMRQGRWENCLSFQDCLGKRKAYFIPASPPFFFPLHFFFFLQSNVLFYFPVYTLSTKFKMRWTSHRHYAYTSFTRHHRQTKGDNSCNH